MDMNLTLLAIALSPTTIMVTFIIFGLRSFRNDLNTGMDRLDKRMDRLDKKTDHDRGVDDDRETADPSRNCSRW